MNKTCIVKIKTGQTQAVANWRTALSAQGRFDEWEEAWGIITGLAERGVDVQANDPMVEHFSVGEKQLAIVYGVLSSEVSPRGRVIGEYRFVLCSSEEVLLVLAKVFDIEKRLQRGA
jgi:hypothetical protein